MPTRGTHVVSPRTHSVVDLGCNHNIFSFHTKILKRLPKDLFALSIGVNIRCIKKLYACIQGSPPKVIVPRQSFDTRSPVFPNVLYSIFSFHSLISVLKTCGRVSLKGSAFLALEDSMSWFPRH